jgi:cell division protein FtsW
MYHFDVERTNSQRMVHLFYACVIMLTGLGLATLYSSSYAYAERFFNKSGYFIIRQSLFGVFGVVLFFFFSYVNLEKLRKYAMLLLIIAAALCVLTMVPLIGVERLGASRWIKIGSLTYQPSEMVKFALPLYLAHILDKKKDNLDKFTTGFLPPALVAGFFFGLICAQNNFSTAVLLLVIVMIIFFFAGLHFQYFVYASLFFVPISFLLVFTRPHRVMRLVSFIQPQWDPLGAGYQVQASRDAIISGGFWGKGIGHGTRKIASVPEIHSDFIFSAFVEETGFLGVVLFLALFAVFAVLGYGAALRSDSVFKRLLASGLTTMIVLQTLLNVAVVSGALPATGIPLPFFSAGGSSLATTLVCAGLIANVSKKGRSPFGHENVNAGIYHDLEDQNG